MSTKTEKRLELIRNLLERLETKSAKGTPIVVEGRNDLKALNKLGITGDIILAKTSGKSLRIYGLMFRLVILVIPPLCNLHAIPFWNQEGHRNWIEQWNPPLRIWNLGILESWNLGMEHIDFIYLQHVWYLFGIV